MNADIFRIILPVLILGFMFHRGYYTRKHKFSADHTLKQREQGGASRVAGMLGIAGFFAMLIYLVNPRWMEWAAAPLSVWMRWAGVAIAGLGFALLQWAQNTLGRNWSDTPRMMNDQVLVTIGPYRWIRHPIYTAFLLILGSTYLISANWLIGVCWTGMTILEIVSRIGFEETLMLEYFGDRYRDYIKKTGRLLPRIISRKT